MTSTKIKYIHGNCLRKYLIFCEFMNIMNKSGRFNNDSGCYIKNVGEAFTRLLRSSYSRRFAGGAQQQQGRAS